MESNKQYLLNKLFRLSNEGMYFPEVGKVTPSEIIVINTQKLLDACDDNLLENWDLALYINGSVLLNYYKHNGIIAMVNIAETGMSGIFSYLDVYIPVEVPINNSDKIIDIFNKTKEYNT